MKTLLPQVAAPVLAEIDVPGVAPVGLGERRPEAVFVRRHEHQMDVIGHQAIGPDFRPRLSAALGEERKIAPVVVVAEKGFLAAVAALGNVVGVSGDDQSRQTRHGRQGYPCRREKARKLYTVPSNLASLR